jgi:hypothetical protein
VDRTACGAVWVPSRELDLELVPHQGLGPVFERPRLRLSRDALHYT